MRDLVERVAAAGFRFEVTDSGPRLVPTRDGARMPRELLTEVKENRGEILLFLASGREPELEDESLRCKVCQREFWTTDQAEVRARMADPAFCDRGGAKETRTLPAEPRCPFKP